MCKVSNKLKLCTCKTKNVERLKHYWILRRHDGGDKFILGEAILPADIGDDADKWNIGILRKMLNEGNSFDLELLHQTNDILELHFTLNSKLLKEDHQSCFGDYLAYAFVFKNGKWKKTDYDPFGANLMDIQNGKIKNPFIKAE